MKLFGIITILLFSTSLWAQNIEFEKENFSNSEKFNEAVETIVTGNDFFFEGNFAKALPQYLVAQEVNPNNALLNFKIGACYLKMDDLKKSMPYFETAKELDPKVDPKIDYAIAKSYQANYKYQEAIDIYNNYLSSLTKSKKLIEEPGIQQLLERCKSELQKEQSRLEMENKEKQAKVKDLDSAVVKTPETASSTPSLGITYRIQIASASVPASTEDLKKYYSGELKISQQKIGPVYKYFIGDFESKEAALKAKIQSGVSDAFVVKFRAGKKM